MQRKRRRREPRHVFIFLLSAFLLFSSCWLMVQANTTYGVLALAHPQRTYMYSLSRLLSLLAQIPVGGSYMCQATGQIGSSPCAADLTRYSTWVFMPNNMPGGTSGPLGSSGRAANVIAPHETQETTIRVVNLPDYQDPESRSTYDVSTSSVPSSGYESLWSKNANDYGFSTVTCTDGTQNCLKNITIKAGDYVDIPVLMTNNAPNAAPYHQVFNWSKDGVGGGVSAQNFCSSTDIGGCTASDASTMTTGYVAPVATGDIIVGLQVPTAGGQSVSGATVYTTTITTSATTVTATATASQPTVEQIEVFKSDPMQLTQTQWTLISGALIMVALVGVVLSGRKLL